MILALTRTTDVHHSAQTTGVLVHTRAALEEWDVADLAFVVCVYEEHCSQAAIAPVFYGNQREATL